jgi:oxalate decarboxylase/phosphoglucose isomerase-like protein (cupin superfamily)
VFDVGSFDHVYVPSNAPHQFVNSGDEPFGFLCIVDTERDRPRALTTQELAILRQKPSVATKIKP